jgi:hypothetical protein
VTLTVEQSAHQEQTGELCRLKIRFRTFEEKRRRARRFAPVPQHVAGVLMQDVAAVQLGVLIRVPNI